MIFFSIARDDFLLHSSLITAIQDSGVVQKIKHGVRLVAGGGKNDIPNHRHASSLLGATAAGAEGGEKAVGWRGGSEAEPNSRKGVVSLPAVHLEVSRASAAAIEYVESHGGTVTCAHFNRLALRALVSGRTLMHGTIC